MTFFKNVITFGFLYISLFTSLHNHLFAETTDSSVSELNRKGIALSEKGLYEEAIPFFKMAVEKEDTKGANSWHNLGFAYEKMGDRKKAIECYQKTLERNPNLEPTLQNLSRMEFLEMNFAKSIIHGEKALKINPRNKEVPRWLPTAYAKAAEKRLFDLKHGTKEKTPESTEKKEKDYVTVSDQKEIIKVGLRADAVFYFIKDSSALALYTQSGPTRTPANFYTDIQINDMFQVKVDIGNPYFGIMQPTFMAGRQTVDYIIHHEVFFWGLGAQFTQIDLRNRSIPERGKYLENTEYYDLNDTKFGFEVGSKGKSRLFRLRVFSSYLFRDRSSAPVQNRFDTSNFLLEFRTRLKLFEKENKDSVFSSIPPEFYAQVKSDEIYLTEYKRPSDNSNRSHWFGTYDILIGMEFGDLNKKFNKTPFTIGFEFAERLYFFDVNNSDVFGVGNSQGFFGLNVHSAVKGDSFPSFRSNSHVFSIFSRQRIFEHWVFSQRVTLETTRTAEPFYGLNLQMGIEARY